MHLFCSLPSIVSSLLICFWHVVDKILPILVLIATIAAAIAAYMSFWVTRKILYYQLLTRYSSPEMGKALEIIRVLSSLRDIATKKTEFIILKDYRLWREGQISYTSLKKEIKDKNGKVFVFNYDCYEVDGARRQVSHFFITAFEMFTKAKVLDKASFQTICAYRSFKFLYYVVEWFEVANATSWEFDPDYDFTKLLELSGRKDIEELEKLRPPRPWTEIDKMIQQIEKQVMEPKQE
jgi:phosphate/sulfate permease